MLAFGVSGSCKVASEVERCVTFHIQGHGLMTKRQAFQPGKIAGDARNAFIAGRISLIGLPTVHMDCVLHDASETASPGRRFARKS
jgi:hypothetical protein